MFIYIDESGSFVPSPSINSWNVVAAYVVPEATRKDFEALLRKLKLSVGCKFSDEIKLRDLTETQIGSFIEGIGRLNSTLFVSCIDLGMQTPDIIADHKRNQVDAIRANKPRMVYEEGRAMIEDLAQRLDRLSLQLYTQMVAQVDLLDQVYRSSTLYYSQRVPATLSSFRWRMDEKNSWRPLFEEVMRHMAAPLLQTKSLREPAIFVEGFDYSHYDRSFHYKDGDMPTYLQEETGIEISSASNLGKVLSDFDFVRSHEMLGVQVADLLASSFRRVLRNEFKDNINMAKRLGRLLVQREAPQPPVHLISLSDDHSAQGHVVDVVRAMKARSRPMLK